ncbi:unnamed protein product, partial [Prorocentrum cordatum]
ARALSKDEMQPLVDSIKTAKDFLKANPFWDEEIKPNEYNKHMPLAMQMIKPIMDR